MATVLSAEWVQAQYFWLAFNVVLSFVTHCATFSQTCGLSGPRIILLKQEATLSCKMLRVKFLSLFTFSCIFVPASIAPSSFHGPSYLFQNAFLTGFLEAFPDAVLERKQELFPGISFLLLLSPHPFHVHVIIETRIMRSLTPKRAELYFLPPRSFIQGEC